MKTLFNVVMAAFTFRVLPQRNHGITTPFRPSVLLNWGAVTPSFATCGEGDQHRCGRK